MFKYFTVMVACRLPYWLEARFLATILGILSTRGEMDNLTRGDHTFYDADEPPKWFFIPWLFVDAEGAHYGHQISRWE